MDFDATPLSHSKDSFQPWELELAEQVVRDFLAPRRPLPGFVLEDLVQECLLHWWQQRHHYRADRGASPATYMRKVLRAKLRDIERGVRAAKRGGGAEPASLDAPINAEHDASESLKDFVVDWMVDGSLEEAAEMAVLRLHIQRVLPLLTARQQKLAQGLFSGHSVSEISRTLGVSRPSLYDEMERIRKVFREEGLEEYLR